MWDFPFFYNYKEHAEETQGYDCLKEANDFTKRIIQDGIATIGMNTQQVYFRIPLIHPNKTNSIGEKGNSTIVIQGKTITREGWLYAHLDGGLIARQMELHPEKPPALLVDGVDDMDQLHCMEQLKLALKTAIEIAQPISKKRGSTVTFKIAEPYFEKEWVKNGGQPFLMNKNANQQEK